MLQVEGIRKIYRKDRRAIRAVDGMSFQVEPGEFLVVHGPSGSGKSTLLLMLGGMLPPDSGRILYRSDDLYGGSAARRNRYRKQAVGFIFQRYFLIPYLSVLDNIRMPLAIQGRRAGAAEEIEALAERLSIQERLDHTPAELSVGEQQRAAVARALVGGKELILADEPTGNLDTANVDIIAQCLSDEQRRGRTVFLVTHNESLLGIGTRSLHIEAGRLVEAA